MTALVFKVNEKEVELVKLTDDIKRFATQQTSQLLAFWEKASEQSSGLERLTRQTEEALVKLDQA